MLESEKVINWIRKYFEENGKGCKAVIGISGGADSSLCAALLVKALGKENVIGVLMPKGIQHDIDVSNAVVNLLGIKHYVINIEEPVNNLREVIGKEMDLDPDSYDVYKTNTPARIRMATLYGVSAIVGGRVCNTCNLSEDWVGYSTKYGDAAGDFSPISDFTKTEVRALGRELGLPSFIVDKTPEDGMSGKSDEEKLGFTYEVLDKYIRTGVCDDPKIKERIDYLNKINLHKLQLMPKYVREK